MIFRITTGRVEVTRMPSTSLGFFDLPQGQWFYMEMKVTIHDTAGAVVVRIDGQTVLNLTNQDTRNGGTGFCNSIQFICGNVGSAYMSYNLDDFYICDTAGSAPFNDFLGDV